MLFYIFPAWLGRGIKVEFRPKPGYFVTTRLQNMPVILQSETPLGCLQQCLFTVNVRFYHFKSAKKYLATEIIQTSKIRRRTSVVHGRGWAIIKSMIPWVLAQLEKQNRMRSCIQGGGEHSPLLHQSASRNHKDGTVECAVDDDWAITTLVTPNLIIWTGAALLLLYFVSVLGFFHTLVTVPATLVAMLLIPLAGFISMRSLGRDRQRCKSGHRYVEYS